MPWVPSTCCCNSSLHAQHAPIKRWMPRYFNKLIHINLEFVTRSGHFCFKVLGHFSHRYSVQVFGMELNIKFSSKCRDLSFSACHGSMPATPMPGMPRRIRGRSGLKFLGCLDTKLRPFPITKRAPKVFGPKSGLMGS